MDSRIPFDIQILLKKYIQLLESELGDKVYGVYIYGSLALGCFDERTSDIDFVTVVKKDLTENDIKNLIAVHKELKDISPYAIRLEGEYITLTDIINGKPKGQYPYFADGKYQGNVWIKNAAWFQLKERGITIEGVEFSNIAGEMDWVQVKNELLERLDVYWPSMINWKLLIFDNWLALIVLTVCRIYYTLGNKAIISKCDGGEYALERLPEEWHKLINEALSIQNNTSKTSLFKSKFERLRKTKEFVKYISRVCNV